MAANTVLPDAVSEDILDLFTGIDLYFSLHDGEPGKAGANEIDGTDYERQKIATADGWSEAAADTDSGGRVQDNAAKVDFGTAGSDWGTVTWIAWWTAATDGTFKGCAKLTTAQTIANGNAVSFAIGDLDFVAAGF